LNSNRFCVANFKVYAPPPPPGGGHNGYSSPHCFIATAAYGSWLDPHVLSLRQFRDEYLLTNAVGSWFVEFYYWNSPPIADYIRERESLRFVVRVLLTPLVYAIEYPAVLLCLAILLLVMKLRKRRVVS